MEFLTHPFQNSSIQREDIIANLLFAYIRVVGKEVAIGLGCMQTAVRAARDLSIPRESVRGGRLVPRELNVGPRGGCDDGGKPERGGSLVATVRP